MGTQTLLWQKVSRIKRMDFIDFKFILSNVLHHNVQKACVGKGVEIGDAHQTMFWH